MIPLQFFSVLFGLFMIYMIRIHQKKGHFDDAETRTWIIIWLGFIVLALFPQILEPVVQQLRFSRVFDALIVISFMILAVINFINRVSIKKLEKKLEKTVRESAIKKLTKQTE